MSQGMLHWIISHFVAHVVSEATETPLQRAPSSEELSPRDRKKEKREKKKENLLYVSALGDVASIKRLLDQGEYP